MNDLQVKTINIKPAVVEFNHVDIEKELEISLKKYEGLVFTEDTATDLRKTIAELRKGKNAVDRYRIDTKKELNAPIKEFEDKCKQLDAKFESVIKPLVEQQNEFEEKRRAEKLEKLEKIRLDHIENHGLDEEYHELVIIDDSMLTKSSSLKQAGDALEFTVKNLKMEQDKKVADKELIITTVKLANSENDLSLSADAYVRLIEFTPFDQVKNQIEQDASAAVEARERKVQAELERIERAKQTELERVEQEMKKIEKEKQPEQSVNEDSSKLHPMVEETFNDLFGYTEDDLPFADDPFIDDPFIDSSPTTKKYSIFATNNELEQLEKWMNANQIDFEVIIDE